MFELLAFVLLCLQPAAAQPDSSESLLQQLEAATNPEAQTLLLADVSISEALLGSCRMRAEERFLKGDFPHSLALHQAAFQLALRLNQPSSAARAQRAIGLCYRRLGRQQDSLEANRRGLEFSQPANDRQASCDLYRGLGLAQRALGQPQQAIASFRDGAQLCREAKDPTGAVRSLVNLASIHQDIGDYREAVRLLLACLEESQTLHDQELSLSLLDNLATAYLRQGDKEVGRVYLERSLQAKQAAGAPPVEISRTLVNLIPIYLSLGLQPKALETTAQVMALATDPTIKGVCLVNRAGVYRELRRFTHAAADLKAALALFEAAQNVNHVAQVLPQLALVHLDLHDNAAALNWARRASQHAQQAGAVDAYQLALDATGMAYLQLGDAASARAAFLDEVRAIESQRASLAGGEQQDLQYLATRSNAYYQLMALDVATKHTAQALAHLENAKARILIDLLSTTPAALAGAITAAERLEEQQLRESAARLAAPSLQGKPQARERWDKANRELESFRATLFAAHPELRVRRADFAPFSLTHAAAALPLHSALIEYAAVNNRLYAFVLTRGDSAGPNLTVHSQSWDAAALHSLIESFRQSIATRDLAYRTTAGELYRRLIAPLEPQLKGITTIGIAPDGPLWNIPFAALLAPNGRHLIEDRALFFAPSITALRHIASRAGRTRAPQTLLAMGAPTLGAFSATLPPLTSSSVELRQIGALYGTTTTGIFSGQAASKERWLAEAPRHQVLHLATHGVLNATHPLYSYLVMSDGLLESREILNQTLHADLVVLSACETGRGKAGSGEGLIGATWAFLAAGSSAVVASQWKVDAASTTQFMTGFHRALRLSRSTPALSVQRAAIQLMHQSEYRHPFYWAPFTVFGKGN